MSKNKRYFGEVGGPLPSILLGAVAGLLMYVAGGLTARAIVAVDDGLADFGGDD